VTLDVLIKPRKFVPQRTDYSPRPDAPLLTHQVCVPPSHPVIVYVC
jgi:hypothetical protein